VPRSYALGDRFEAFIDAQVKSGRYNNASEVVRDALRLLEDQEKVRELRLAELVVLSALDAQERGAKVMVRTEAVTVRRDEALWRVTLRAGTGQSGRLPGAFWSMPLAPGWSACCGVRWAPKQRAVCGW
jgi:putative addiction module CopG family antidote